MKKSRELDQFYTKPIIAKECYYFLTKFINKKSIFFEPSAGSGSFYNLLPKNSRIGIDLDPKHDEIIKMNFFNFDNNDIKKLKKTIVTVGNPPFGKNSSLAIKFLNKAAEFSNYIGFILPKTFKKDSVLNKIEPRLHLIAELDLPKNSFIFNNEEYDVPCIFQVWEKRENKREKIEKPIVHKDFIFTDKNNGDFAIRRVGGLAGKIIMDFENFSPASHYYIKTNIKKQDIIKTLSLINWDIVKNNTAGNPSISKRELIELYSQVLNI